MADVLGDLTQAVKDEETVIDSAVTLLKTLADKIQATAGDAAAATALAAEVRGKSQELADAVVANTPAEPAVS